MSLDAQRVMLGHEPRLTPAQRTALYAAMGGGPPGPFDPEEVLGVSVSSPPAAAAASRSSHLLTHPAELLSLVRDHMSPAEFAAVAPGMEGALRGNAEGMTAYEAASRLSPAQVQWPAAGLPTGMCKMWHTLLVG